MKNVMRASFMWGIVSLLMVLHFFLLLSVGVITADLRNALQLTALELSFLSSSYLYMYLLLQTPAGILLDQFGARKLLTIGSIVCAVGCWVFANCTSLAVGMLSRVMMGGGLAFVFIASIQLASRWFAARYLGMMIGFSEAAGMAGAIIGNMLLAIFITQLGWRYSFNLAALCSLVLAVLTWIFVRDHPNKLGVVPERSKLTVRKVTASLKILVREKQIWLQSLYIALMYDSITVFCGLWANPFLRRAFQLSLEQATWACCLILAGIGIGSPIAGVLCSNMHKRIVCIQYSALVMFALMCIVLYVPTLSYVQILCLMFALGLSGSSIVLSFAVVSDIVPEGTKSTGIGLTNTFSLTSAVVLQPLVGWMLNILSNQVGKNGLEYYTATHYRQALTVLPISIIIAFWISLVMSKNLKKTKRYHSV